MKELIGFFASLLVVSSFLFNGETKIRKMNIIGALFFIAYGVLVHAWSTAGCNVALLIINAYKMLKCAQK